MSGLDRSRADVEAAARERVDGTAGRRGRRGRVIVLGIAVIVVAFIAAGVAVLLTSRGPHPSAGDTPDALPTIMVRRGDVVATTQVTGSLGYGVSTPVVGERAGTLTSLPAVGDRLARGTIAYTIDLRPIPLLYGNVPLARTLSEGAIGADVAELESNLAALGYAPPTMTVDSTFTAATAVAVERWQSALGVSVNGSVSAGDAVVASGGVRVVSVSPVRGEQSSVGEPLFSVSGIEHIVHVDLDVSLQQDVGGGAPVRVELPNGRTIDGRIRSIGTVATSGPTTGPGSAPTAGGTGSSGGASGGAPSGGGAGSSIPTIPVDITLAGDAAATANLDQAPVTVDITVASRDNVLSVPVEALLARPGGGYAVTVVDRTGSHAVPVATGLFSAGDVEVSGPGLAIGTRVEVPSL